MVSKRTNTSARSSYDGNHNLCGTVPKYGRVKYHVKGEPMYRTLENVSSPRSIRDRLRELHKGKKIDYISDVEQYEPYKEAYMRNYYENIFKHGDRNKDGHGAKVCSGG